MELWKIFLKKWFLLQQIMLCVDIILHNQTEDKEGRESEGVFRDEFGN